MHNRIRRRARPPADLTALVDVAFLLLAFFLLSSHFKPAGRVDISSPASHSFNPHFGYSSYPQATISLTRTGKVFLNFHDPQLRARILLRAAVSNKIDLSPHAVLAFAKAEDFGGSLRGLLIAAGTQAQHSSLLQSEIPIQNNNNELLSWLKWAKDEARGLQFNIRADSDAPYPPFEAVVAALQYTGINQFKLLTTLERDNRIAYH